MAKKEVKTDLWVARQLDDLEIAYDAQGSEVKEINDALQSASKNGTGNTGYPEYVAVVKDFVIVIEDTPDYEYMEQYAKNLMLRKYKQYLDYLDSKEKA